MSDKDDQSGMDAFKIRIGGMNSTQILREIIAYASRFMAEHEPDLSDDNGSTDQLRSSYARRLLAALDEDTGVGFELVISLDEISH